MSILEGTSQDFLQAIRRATREPGVSTVAIVTMALGIGATATLATIAEAVLLSPLPWPRAEELVRIEERRGGRPPRSPWTVTNGVYNAWREKPATIDGLAAWIVSSQILRGIGDSERVQVAAVTPSLFGVLRTRPEIGRLFVDEDATTHERGTAVLSYGLWQERFGGERSVVGRTILLDGRPHDVIGVLSPGFRFPDRETRIWVPFEPLPLLSRDGRQIRVIALGAIARLSPAATTTQAAAEATARARGVPDIGQAALSHFGSRGEVSVIVTPAVEVATAEVQSAVALLLVGVVLLLGASVASVVGIQVARAAARRHESAVRAALGASLIRLARRWLAESLVLAAAAGALGVLIASLLCRGLPWLLPPDFPRVDDIAVDLRAVLTSLLLTIVVALACGVIPALWARPAGLAAVLAEDRVAAVAGTGRTTASRLRALIIVGQVAVATVLLTGSTLLGRSFVAMVKADRGYDASELLTARLTFPHQMAAATRVQRLEALQERLYGLPRVSHAAFGNGLPLVGQGNVFGRTIPAPQDPATTLQIAATWRVVSPDYLPALGLRSVAGRLLTGADGSSSVPAIVVNESFARAYLVGDAVGQRLRLAIGSKPEWEVVGVVEDARLGPLTEPTGPEFFVSYRQQPEGLAWDPMLLIRGGGDPSSRIASLRALVSEVDPVLVLDSVMAMEARVVFSLATPRAYALVLSSLALLSLLIAGVGLFGVLSYTTTRRAAEIGVRLAVGATPVSIMGVVALEAVRLTTAGLLIGGVVTFFAAEALSKFLYGVAPRDGVSFVGASALVSIAAVVACVVPAKRASRVDPVQALRVR